MKTPAPSNYLLHKAALMGFVGVACGAFGAHSLRPSLEARGMMHAWETAVFYQLIHAVVLLFLSREAAPRWVGHAFLWGVVLFSGSLYLLAQGGPHWLGPLTPLGGAGLLAGWIGLILHAGRKA